VNEEPELTDEQKELLESVAGAFPESPNLRVSMLQLFGAQNHLKKLPGILKSAGVKSTDPLSVGAYVEIHTALEAQAHHERTVNLMTMLALNNKIMQTAGDTATIAQTYKAILDDLMSRAKREEAEG